MKKSKKDFASAAASFQVKEFNPGASTISKLPADISGGKEPLSDFMNIPVDKLTPYRSKGGMDFSRQTPVVEEAMADSIRLYGVIEPVTVRPAEGGMFEILAGESRWLGAKQAELPKIPCHILHLDDTGADAVFALTNIVRRDMSYRDRINGWWRYTEALRSQNQLQVLRRTVENPEIQSAAGLPPGALGWRQIQRYVSCHSLIDEWIDRLDSRSVGFMTAYQISQFPQDIQRQLLDSSFTGEELRELLDLYRKSQDPESGVKWEGSATVDRVLNRTPENPLPRGFRTGIVRAAREGLRPEDYSRGDQVVAEALRLYYETRDGQRSGSADTEAGPDRKTD